ncbi:FKBP-type peptidyl-prolyl cis-trans isomerase [Nocardia cyriacigeorgica]|uniref:FKBP-type peptidyl-prolyl cis-trans isomerase n=1 Tax=Nocardia cyriacigeorgica TaxID=135487 RepID=UPI0018943768|nr:FKBP-type peptidyl-prolyl cis-trans isomerase [Nocardia cyriacigeorgica]MBF6415217.1 FKBP-type peptidyl-prolyl cis-trans isomerase [Nocardia cyriacigeorgica]
MPTSARTIGIATLAAAAFALTACGSDDSSDSAAPATTAAATSAYAATGAPTPKPSTGRECTAEDIDVTGGFGAAPAITIPDDCDPPKQLIVKDLVTGSGPGAQPGQELKMNYTLVTWSDKQKLDSSFDRGEPFELTLGAGMVIPGWDQGLEGVQEGTRRLLIIPPDLGYGMGGNGIKPNETLVFVTDAVDVPDN